jgi:RNA polymerase sigma factor (sigma-70 family)
MHPRPDHGNYVRIFKKEGKNLITTRLSANQRPNDFGELFRAIAPDVILALIHLGIGRAHAEDALQNVFLKLLHNREKRGQEAVLSRFGTRSEFRNYVLRAALNEYRDEYRRMLLPKQKEAVLLESIESRFTHPDHDFTTKDVDALYRAISRLKKSYRMIFELLLREEIPLAEIARRIRRKPSSIYTQYGRGLRLLRKLFEEELSR